MKLRHKVLNRELKYLGPMPRSDGSFRKRLGNYPGYSNFEIVGGPLDSTIVYLPNDMVVIDTSDEKK